MRTPPNQATQLLAAAAVGLLFLPAGVGAGDCRTAEALTGDWWGNRSCLAESGVTFNLDVAHFYQGVASGGLDRRFAYGGHGDYVANVDFGKLGVQEGLFLKIRAEHRFGENINRDTGAFLPAAVLADLPAADEEGLYLTNFLFMQFLSERSAVYFGKLDTLDGDLNAFAHGRGKTQFLGTGFVANPIALRTIPYATLGCGFMVLGEGAEPLFNFTLLNSRDTATTAGFDELFEDGVAMSAEVRLPTHALGMPGHQLLGVTWNSRDYVALGQDPRAVFPSIPINQTSGSWSVYWNFDHYLQTWGPNQSRGWGLFGRVGFADDDANPLSRFYSFGVGGDVPGRCGGRDTFGVGWYYAGGSDQIGPLIEAVTGPIRDGQGVELFYNRRVADWLHVTPDLQVIVPGHRNANTAVAVGVRAVMRL